MNPTASLQFANDPKSALYFPFNVNQLNWNYSLNRISYDTYGGRVVQILSVKIETMTVQGDAGSRASLLALFESLKALQLKQVNNQQSLLFTVPNRVSLNVWFRNINIGWDPSTVTYPYDLSFEIEDGGGYNELSKVVMNRELFNLAGIGYNEYYAGMQKGSAGGQISYAQVTG